MYANDPKMAQEWSKETAGGSRLPEKVKSRKKTQSRKK
jgi:hypothetical protein